MCIAIYKPMGADFPNKKTLQRCFEHNPDGAGFMVAADDKVIIHKGFMGFRSFWKALRATRYEYGDDRAFVMHFRISTQGGVRADGCHPFPLSGNMDDLRLLDTTCDVGIAHNGIITMCSTSFGAKVDYSDTMEFITQYLSLIIKDRSYYKDVDTLKLITRMCGSRLAILDKRGHCELIGKGWMLDDGVWYSNDSYKERAYVPPKYPTTIYYPTLTEWVDEEPTATFYGNTMDADEEWAWIEYFDKYLGADGLYDFSQTDCPATEIGDCSYCDFCKQYGACYETADYEAEKGGVA